MNQITPIRVGILRVLIAVGWDYSRYLKLVRIMVENLTLAHKYKNILSFRKYTF